MRAAPRHNGYRNAWCSELRGAGEEVRLAGWVHRRRDHGRLIFIDLRDRSGVVQLVFDPDRDAAAFAIAESLRAEHVVTARGVVVERDPTARNPRLPTGDIELQVFEAECLAVSETPPFPIDEDRPIDELTRLRHRALDLRREPMLEALVVRDAIVQAMRGVLAERDFLEIETPILAKSTPEGARDFLVPSRLQPGNWYALPQSPQLFKQLLMLAGYERYYQVARCFRDEDLRADRQPEFTQLDIEMAFVDEEDVIDVTEAVMQRVFELTGFSIAAPPWPRMGFDEAMLRFGSDRPDLRLGLEIRDVSDLLAASEFKVFRGALDDGGVVRALNAGARDTPRSLLDALTDTAKRHGAKGLVWGVMQEDGEWRSPTARFLSAEEKRGIAERLEARPGHLLLAVADDASVAAKALGALRIELGEPAPGHHEPVWVVDFPMFEWNSEEARWDPLHHPFCAPVGALDDPGRLRARGYDFVVDGSELGGGSIRIHRAEVQRRIFETIGVSPEEADARFGFLLDALRYGAPPHGGIALGLDRVVATIAGRDSIRDVIAFPKTASGGDPMTGAPSRVDPGQVSELGLQPAGPHRR
jgi:aspartyl-tRNA synthetase